MTMKSAWAAVVLAAGGAVAWISPAEAAPDSAVAVLGVEASEGAPRWTGRALDAALAEFREEHGTMRSTGDAIGPRATKLDDGDAAVTAVQTFFDDEGETLYAAFFRVPLDVSRERGEPVLVLERIATG